jgi:hypothetical protein
MTPLFDLLVDLLVQVAYRRLSTPRAPKRLRDVCHPPDAHSSQIHLDRGLFHQRLALPVTLDDGRCERQAAEHQTRSFALPALVCNCRSSPRARVFLRPPARPVRRRLYIVSLLVGTGRKVSY